MMAKLTQTLQSPRTTLTNFLCFPWEQEVFAVDMLRMRVLCPAVRLFKTSPCALDRGSSTLGETSGDPDFSTPNPAIIFHQILERLGESGATHDSQSASRSGVEAWVARNLNGPGGTTPMPDSARAESGARADWQACTTHAFLLDHRTSCTVFRAIVVFAMTIMARSFTTHLTSFVVHRVRFGPDSRESGPNPGTGLT